VNPLRSSLSAIAGTDTVLHIVSTARGSRNLVERFVAGETGADEVAAVRRLAGEGLRSTSVRKSASRRTLADAATFAAAGSPVRLAGGTPLAVSDELFATPHEVDLTYVRAANLASAGEEYPMVATDDPRLTGVVTERALWHDRKPGVLHTLASRT
jgi:hypothetical protein